MYVLYDLSDIFLRLLNREERKTEAILNTTVFDFLSNSYISKEISEEIGNNIFWSFWEDQIKCPGDIV